MADNNPNSTPLASDSKSGEAPPPQIIIQQQTSMFGRFGRLLLVALGVSILVILGLVGRYQSYFGLDEGVQEKYHSLQRNATNKVAVINVRGTILEGDGFVKKQIDRVLDDKDVVAVVLRINSPGGTVTGSDYIYHHLRELVDERQLPLVVSMGSLCTSGGYYVAMAVGDQEETIFAEPTTWTGSIGVIIPHYDLSGLLGWLSIKDDSLASGPLKEMGSPTRPMTDQQRKLLQGLVDESFTRFKEIVVHGRPKFKNDPEALDDVATGQIFTANQAMEHGLVDRLGFIEDAIERAAELSGHDVNNLRCVQYKEPSTFLGELMGADTPLRAPDAGLSLVPDRRRGVDLATWFDLEAPRAYYLWTWLPTAFSNTRP